MQTEYVDVEARYLSPREAAQYLSIPVKQLEHLRRRGGGPRYVKLARMIRYPKVELDRWMADRLIANTAEEVRG